MTTILHDMGNIARQEVQIFQGDLIHDGITIERYGLDKNFIWGVRGSGTNITCLDGWETSNSFYHSAKLTIESNNRIFLLRPGQNQNDEPYIVEVDRDHALELILFLFIESQRNRRRMRGFKTNETGSTP